MENLQFGIASVFSPSLFYKKGDRERSRGIDYESDPISRERKLSMICFKDIQLD